MPKVIQRLPKVVGIIGSSRIEEVAQVLNQAALDFLKLNKLSLEGFTSWNGLSELNKQKYRYAAEQVINRLKEK